MTTTFGTSHGPTQPLMGQLDSLQQPTLPPFIFEPFNRNLGTSVFRITATTAPANRNLPDHKTLRF